MIKVSLKEAEGHLGELIEEAAAGKEVVIINFHGVTVRLVPVSEEWDQQQEPETPSAPRVVGPALDRFVGTWSAEQEAELLKAVEVFERVDESFWR